MAKLTLSHGNEISLSVSVVCIFLSCSSTKNCFMGLYGNALVVQPILYALGFCPGVLGQIRLATYLMVKELIKLQKV